ncbi:GSL2 [Candida theae]|uniref:1,3-beta-glucan synthase n=1 Tax=Candida theae TaxID=1198502 RepID=A0AAD5FXV8_9ASCO|nr:GSL2 [Candida theae]KAI5955534.1 GSL2 [Candida theae]
MAIKKGKDSKRIKQESDPIELLKRTATAIDNNTQGYASGFPLSGFKTPHFDSRKWAEVERIGFGGDKDYHYRNPGETLAENDYYDIYSNKFDPYPAWNPAETVPITREDIEAVFLQLTAIFGFQFDNTRNMFDYLMRLLDSRSSRLGPEHALRSVHADYVGGINSNFRKWYFAAQMDLDDFVGFENVKNGKIKDSNERVPTLEVAEEQWIANMQALSPTYVVIQLGLYLLIWGEANNIRFMPECICFIFKCCNDYYFSIDPDVPVERATVSFLDHIITPLYNFYRDQLYRLVDGRYHRRDKDHSSAIGYDDMNQLFWHSKGLERLVLADKQNKLMQLPPKERYGRLNEVQWDKAFYKTFKEKRSWSHVLTNFHRVWVIHLSAFWYYSVYNSPTLYTRNYQASVDNLPTYQTRLSLLSLGGSVALIINLLSLMCELSYIPRKWHGAQPVLGRMLATLLFLMINTAPSIYLLGFRDLGENSKTGLTIASIQFTVSIFIVGYLSVVPLGKAFARTPSSNDRKYLPQGSFIVNFYLLTDTDKIASHSLWLAIFISKFLESYFFLTLSMRDPIRELSIMKHVTCSGETLFGSWLCSKQPYIVLGLIYLTNLVLFILDTYLWYIIWNTLFSVCRSFYVGVSIWTPWRNIFSRLPKRIFSKIISVTNEKSLKSKSLISQVWNSIIISMYREHLISLENVQKLIYKSIENPGAEGGIILKEPMFFVSQEDQSVKSTLFSKQSEAQRRITFFAQSLSTPMPEVGPIHFMPSFSVLVPHYSEKIILSLREIIREEEQYSHVTMLEYLKQLHPLEWSCFVKDTKMLAEEFESDSASTDDAKDKLDDLPYYSVGFKVATPEYILRTRIWASLRSQTLYRTISGFMNYARAIKLLFDVENPDSTVFGDGSEKTEHAAIMAHRKFRIITSMQRMKYFTPEERENTDFLLRAYPELQICYLDEEIDERTGEVTFYSALIDGSCSFMENGDREPKYRVRLSGNPILGDGKSDNQNHSLIFCRGEYIQLVDANQDNYLEECLKIRSVLAEFEEPTFPLDPYTNELEGAKSAYPVAIIGTREYVFSENIGILGDVAAGKEQTFGTLFARTLAHIGGKLHYGHPDFLNAIFMTTRGGVSKAQKGLHLNEDIYAGMNVLLRGGRIKHCEYMQCGKGRDLGFGSILNFTTKIGAGMGEQMLSREYFYLGTQLPIDRFLSFYYAHPGFHLNNVFIILSIQLFLLVSANLASLTRESTICEYDRHRPITDPKRPAGCYNLMPVVQWLQRCVVSIFSVFIISFVPLGVQELTERGFYKAITRLSKQFASFSPLFEVFICKIYGHSLVSDISVGGARYLATGRGFATIRVSFVTLYSRFAAEIGVKSKRMSLNEEIKVVSEVKPSRIKLMLTESVFQLSVILIIGLAYLFANSQNGNPRAVPVNSILRIAIVAFGPIFINFVILLVLFIISILFGPIFTFFCKKLPSFLAALAHFTAVLNHVFFFEVLWFLQGWDFPKTVLGFTLATLIQCWFLQMTTILFVSKEFRHDRSNRSWWSGKWATAGLGWYVITQPIREFVCKTAEMSYFVGDLFAAHVLLYSQIPILLIPYADKWHTLMLFCAIEAIYPDSVCKEAPQTYTFTSPNHESIRIQINFPTNYPDEAPELLSLTNENKSMYTDTVYLEKVVRSMVTKAFAPGQVLMYELLTQLSEFLDEYSEKRIESTTRRQTTEVIEKPASRNISPAVDEAPDYKDHTIDWVKSDVISDRRSTFVAFAKAVESLEDAKLYIDSLLQDRKVSKAAHNISSWRIKTKENVRYQDFDDDGETAAGGRVLHLLQMMDVWNVVVVVSRYFGGVHLGPDRFKHINAVARDAVTKAGFLEAHHAEDAGNKSKRK